MKLTGVKQLDSKLAKLDSKLGKRTLRRSQKQVLKPILQDAKANAPVDTGEYKAGHKIRAGRRSRVNLETEVQVKGVRHAPLVEFDKKYKDGRVVKGAHNLENAYEKHADNAVDKMIDAIWAEVKKVTK